MKYLAILKDSFYETIDFKLFYVLIGLSVVLSLICAAIQFPRKPTREVFSNHWGGEFRIDDPTVLSESLLFARGEYRVTMVPVVRDELARRMTDKVKQAAMIREMRRRMLRGERRSLTLPAPDQSAFTPPASAAEWQKLIRDYLQAVPGIRVKQFGELAVKSAEPPRTVSVDLRANWADVPEAYKVRFAFGIWETDLGANFPLSMILLLIQSTLIDWIAGWGGILIGIVVTAGFIPNMLRKGTIDLLLVKPISRPALLVYKYLGGLSFVFLNAVVLVGGTWLAFGFSSGIWSPWYLTSILVLTFFFAILYSLSVLVGVVTRSQLAAILLTIGMWFALFIVSRIYVFVHPTEDIRAAMQLSRDLPPAVVQIVDTVHFLLPKPSDLSILNQSLLLRGLGTEEAMIQQEELLKNFSWTETLATNGIFIALMLGLASWRFSRKDF